MLCDIILENEIGIGNRPYTLLLPSAGRFNISMDYVTPVVNLVYLIELIAHKSKNNAWNLNTLYNCRYV